MILRPVDGVRRTAAVVVGAVPVAAVGLPMLLSTPANRDIELLQAPLSGFDTSPDGQSIDVVDTEQLAELSEAGYRLVLVGIGIAAMLGAVIDVLMTRAQVWDAQVALRVCRVAGASLSTMGDQPP